MEVYNETVIDHINGASACSVSSGDRKVRNILKQLAEKHPEECVCLAANADGSVWYEVPWDWIRIRPPVHRTYTEEQLEAKRAQLKSARESTQHVQK